MKDIYISHHSEKSWKDGYFQSAMIGQEFVFEEDDRVLNWALEKVLDGRMGSVKY